MDVGNLLQLQGALHGNGIIDSPSDEKDLLRSDIAVGKTLDPVLIVQKQLDLIRQAAQIPQHFTEFLLCHRMAHAGKLHGEQIQGNELGAVGLGGGNRDLRSGPGIHHIIRLAGDGASHHVHDAEHLEAPLLRFPQGRKGIRRFAGLADYDHHGAILQDGVPVTEFAGEIHFDRDPRHSLQHILSGHARMIGGAAGHDVDFFHLQDLLIGHSQLLDHNVVLFDSGAGGVRHGLGLLIHLLEHEMLITGLFRRFRVPVDCYGLLLQLLCIHVVNMKALR